VTSGPNGVTVCRRGESQNLWRPAKSNDRPRRHTFLVFDPLVTPYENDFMVLAVGCDKRAERRDGVPARKTGELMETYEIQ
jgi:hypothetical protein